MPLNVWIFLAAAFLIRMLLASLFPLTADESYYWLWSKHLDLSYVDHPPMVAYINFLTTLGKENLFALRLGATTIVTLISIAIYFLAREFSNQKVAFFSVVLFQLIPHFLVIWLTMFVELPLALFWTLALFILLQTIKSQKKKGWYFLALLLGLGYLSKYTMFLFWPCLMLFFFMSPANRFFLRQKEFYLSFLTSILFFLPVIYWNSQHHLISFTFHSAKAVSAEWGANFLPFIGDQLVHFTPFLLFALYPVFKYSLKKDETTKLLFCFSAPVFILFFVLSFKIIIWAHWPSVGYIAAIPLTISYLVENGKSLKRFISWISLFSLLILIILLWFSPGVLLHQKYYALNYISLPQGYKIFAKTNVSASLLEFYTKQQTYMTTGFLKTGSSWGKKQYEIWSIPKLKKGESILYFGEDTPDFRRKAEENFEKTIDLPKFRLHLIEDYINNNYKMFMLEGSKKSSQP